MKNSPEGENWFKLAKKKRINKRDRLCNLKNREKGRKKKQQFQGGVNIIQQTSTGEKQKNC